MGLEIATAFLLGMPDPPSRSRPVDSERREMPAARVCVSQRPMQTDVSGKCSSMLLGMVGMSFWMSQTRNSCISGWFFVIHRSLGASFIISIFFFLFFTTIYTYGYFPS